MTHAIRTTGLLRSRDLFVHDGARLRRIRLSVPVQITLLAIAAMMLAWSAFAAAHFLRTAEPQVVAASDDRQLQQLAAAAEQRAQVIEQRQKLLATMLAGGEVDPARRRCRPPSPRRWSGPRTSWPPRKPPPPSAWSSVTASPPANFASSACRRSGWPLVARLSRRPRAIRPSRRCSTAGRSSTACRTA